MAQEKAKVVPISESSNAAESSARVTKTKPTKTLPTDRIITPKQLDLIRAYAVTSNFGSKPIRSTEVADVSKMSVTTIHMANPFMVDVGLLQKTELGFLPSPEVISYARAHEWNPATASQKLASLFEETWFAKELLTKLSFRQMSETEAITDLADAASAGPEYRKHIRILVEFLEAVGLIQRDGDFLRRATAARSTSPDPPPTQNAAEHREPQQREPQHRDSQPIRSTISTVFSQHPEGVVQFHVSIKVDMAELSTWTPDRIAAFFAGIAQVLAAKGAVEEQAGKG